MIHRDVKPDNLLIDDQGLVKVADLGLVKTPTVTRADDQLTEASARSGLHSLPPEMTGARIGARHARVHVPRTVPRRRHRRSPGRHLTRWVARCTSS